jgi:hypothetical protein
MFFCECSQIFGLFHVTLGGVIDLRLAHLLAASLTRLRVVILATRVFLVAKTVAPEVGGRLGARPDRFCEKILAAH